MCMTVAIPEDLKPKYNEAWNVVRTAQREHGRHSGEAKEAWENFHDVQMEVIAEARRREDEARETKRLAELKAEEDALVAEVEEMIAEGVPNREATEVEEAENKTEQRQRVAQTH